MIPSDLEGRLLAEADYFDPTTAALLREAARALAEARGALEATDVHLTEYIREVGSLVKTTRSETLLAKVRAVLSRMEGKGLPATAGSEP